MLHLLRGAKSHRSLSEQLGNLTMHPMFAFPILIIVLWLLYKIVGQFGAGTCVDFCQKTIFQGYLLPSVESWAAKVASPESLAYQVFFSHDAGLISVGLTYSLSIVGPIVTFFFLAFGLMEDSGYLPRLAVMLDKTFKKIGLTGKAALPMVLGLGCDTMATLTARILDTRKQRTIAILLLALAVPCSAQLGVISAVLGSVSGLAFSIYVLVIVSQLLFVGFLASKVIPGAPADFMIEIPPFRVPDVRNIVVKTLYRLHWFLREAVPLFLLGTFILFVLMQLGILRWLETGASPLVVGVLGLPKETTAGFILGFLRRDYGVISIFAALDKVEHGHIAPSDLLVALTVMTLFVPCLANFFVMIKEQGMKRAAAIVAFIFPYAFLVGGLLRQALRFVGI
jgi:ferrous iron transport protein B